MTFPQRSCDKRRMTNQSEFPNALSAEQFEDMFPNDEACAEDLRGFMAARPVLDKAEVAVEACGGPRARTARRLKLELRAARVALVPPKGRTGEPDLEMLAVSAVVVCR